MLRNQHLVDQVIRILKTQISTGAYPVGSRLPPEPRLMESLGVGRSTLREAVRVLSHGGVLEVRQGNGTYVRALPGIAEPLVQRLQRAQIHEVQEVRRVLELEIARLAATRRTADDLAVLWQHLDARRVALANNQLEVALDADLALHRAVAVASKNPVLIDLYQAFATTLRSALTTIWKVREGEQLAQALHHRLVAAIAEGDGDAAAAAVTAILNSNLEVLSDDDLQD
jgi:DNA-binding FadR family transcriptional regulator